jgi:dTDP-4-amino-4,6-dideoxygalactose transaminase
MKPIYPVDFKAQYQNLQTEIDSAIARVLGSGVFILDCEVRAFEAEFAAYCGAQYGMGVGSGTEALHLALLAVGIQRDDEVITVSHTAVATVAAIDLCGARPVLVDIDPQRYTMDPERFEAAITPRTKAVIPVHLYGCPADLAPILEIARRKNIFVIEDCAQAHGATYQGKRVGAWGNIAAFSFYPTKNLGAYGDGGGLVTNNEALAKRVALLRQYGWQERYISTLKGLNSRLDELQAAILRVKLGHLDAWNAQRQKLATLYTELLQGYDLTLPSQPADSTHVYHQYVVRHARRDQLKAFLFGRGIHSYIHYPLPIHLQPGYIDLGYVRGDLPATEMAAEQVLSLPLYPEMSEDAVREVSRVIVEFFNQ